MGQLFPVLYLTPVFAIPFAIANSVNRIWRDGLSPAEALAAFSSGDVAAAIAGGFVVAVVVAFIRMVRAARRAQRRQPPCQRLAQVVDQGSIEPRDVIVQRHRSWERPKGSETYAAAGELPAPLRDFLDVWYRFHDGTPWQPLGIQDPLWRYRPTIAPTGRRFDSRHNVSFEGVYQFVTFWQANGMLAHPAVDAVMMTETGRVAQRGQTVQAAFKKKGAKWITRLTLVGAFRSIELLNLLHNMPDSLTDQPAPSATSWDNLGYVPFAILETYSVP